MNVLPPLSRLPTQATGADCAGDKWPKSTGACVMLFVDYKGKPCIILFQDYSTKRYEHAGGGCDPKEDPAVAAARELREETGNLFHMDPDLLKSLPMAQTGEYRGFAVKLTVNGGYHRADFRTNMQKILKGKPSHSWKEMGDMCYVALSTLLNTGLLSSNLKTGDFPTFDVDGQPIVFRNRDAAILRTLWLSKTSVPGPEIPAMVLKKRTAYDIKKKTGSSNPIYDGEAGRGFLNGTTWYE